MSNTFYVHPLNWNSELNCIEKRGSESWWIARRSVSKEGKILPGSRVVFFSYSEKKAKDWLENQGAVQLTTEQMSSISIEIE